MLTSYLVYVLEWETKGLVCGALGRIDVVQSIEKGLSREFLLVLALLDGPSVEPGHVL